MPAIPGGRGPNLVTEFVAPRGVVADAPQTTTLAPTEGAIVLAGNIPAITLILAAVVGAVTLSGNAPALAFSYAPTQGAVVIGGNAPAISKTLAPSEGAVVLGGNAPSIVVANVLSPTEGAIVLGGNAPSLGKTLQASSGAVVLSGNAPGLQAALGPSDGAVVVAGNVPRITVTPFGPIVVLDTHDGGHAKKRHKRFKEEQEKRREDIRQAFELTTQGKPDQVQAMSPAERDDDLALILFLL